MLVLSRRQDDKVLFPNLGIIVHILRVEGSKVRVGVDAPPDVKILRHELRETPKPRESTGVVNANQSGAMNERELKQRLSSATECLDELYRLCDRDLPEGSERLILKTFRQLRAIDEGVTDQVGGPHSESRLRRALLVDDNLNECKLLASYLRMQEFDVDVANDGAAAIDYLDSHSAPDVVLLDMQMPGVDGPSAIRHLRADEKHHQLKVYAVSGSDPAEYGVGIGPEGVDGWFPKPLDPETLVFRLAFDADAAAPTQFCHQKDSMACS